MPLNLSPISTPRVAQIAGAKTQSAQDARAAAMAAFNATAQTPVEAPLTSGQSPSQPGATLTPDAAPVVSPDTALPLTPTNDAPPTEAPVSDVEARINAHYANLARKEKMLRIREARINQKLAQTAPSTQAPPPTQAFDPAKYVAIDDLAADPFGILSSRANLSYEQLTQKALEAPSAEDLAQRRELLALRAELQAVKDAQTETQKTFKENETAQRTQAEAQIHQDVNHLLTREAANFEVTRAHNAARDVTNLIIEVYDKGMGANYPRGTLLDVYEAAQMVEQHLTDQGVKVAQLSKIQSRLASTSNANKQPQNTNTPNTSTLRTLTNNVGTGTRKLSSRERALAAFRGEVVS